MKRVSAKMFFSVLWKGICQALGWGFGLFGYKREGKFAKCVWGLFAISGTIIVTFIAGALIYELYREARPAYLQNVCDDENCYYNTYISRNVYMHDHGDGKAWVKNSLTGKKTLTGIAWISKPLGEKDSLIVFSDGKNRGYFNKYTGEVAIPAKYKRAWVFSDGIASVEENGIIKFIDTKGNQLFDRTFAYDPDYDGYVFHGGYCIVDEDNDKKYGLMNTKGITVLPEEYDNIRVSCDLCYWTLTKGDESCVVDKEFNAILPMTAANMFVYNDEIDVTMADHTVRKYDLSGKLINDFYINSVRKLEYETDEMYLAENTVDQDSEEGCDELEPWQHKRAIARLRAYSAGDGYEGLMTADGHVVSMPMYEDIEAIDHDTYICTVSNDNKIIVNGKGQVVR